MLPSHGELHNYFPRPNADNVVNIANADLLREREKEKKSGDRFFSAQTHFPSIV